MHALLRNMLLGSVPCCALACQIVFGDFEIVPPTTAPTVCRAGQWRCSGAWLLSCNLEQDGWTRQATCDSAGHCDSALGRCTDCASGEYRCQDAELGFCDPVRKQWDPYDLCTTADNCNLNSNSCRACTPGELHCNGASLQQCTTDYAWTILGTCATSALCQSALRAGTATCAMSQCSIAGLHVCDGARLLKCAAGLDRLELVQTCATPELCRADLADNMAAQGQAGQCQPAVCQPNEYTCDGDTLRRCKYGRTGWDPIATCDPANPCNVNQRACIACFQGEVQCNGALLQQCTGDKQWRTLQTCRTALLCNQPERRCDEPECEPVGAVRCVDETNAIEQCSADLRWTVVDVCVTRALCNLRDQRCDPPACKPGTTRCNGDVFESCRPDVTGWELPKQCHAESCDPAKGCIDPTTPCAIGAFRCNDVYLEQCVQPGRWLRMDRCEGAELCDPAGQCGTPECGGDRQKYECRDNGDLVQCASNRTDWELNASCGNSICDAGYDELGPPQCDRCLATTYSCDNGILKRCASDGQSNPQVADCSGGCSDTKPDVPSCLP